MRQAQIGLKKTLSRNDCFKNGKALVPSSRVRVSGGRYTSMVVMSHDPDGEALVQIFTVDGNVDTGGWSVRGMVPAD